MNRKEPTMIDLLIDTHLSLERQGPGSTESTEMALGFIKGLSETSQIADLGCGTGEEVITIAKKTKGTITGLDLFPSFIDSFTKRMIRSRILKFAI
jgi:ubiquinone/menaquinone biosynthesis C-methylase UbiE